MEACMQLNEWTPAVAVVHIRLNCVPKLQQTIDTRYTGDKWENLNPKQALDAIGELVTHSTNQAVRWSSFFSSRQGEMEPMKEYFQRCSAEAAECGFQCPECEVDLSDYMLLRKLVVGLSDPVLKKEVFQGCPTLTSVEKLREKCFAHEAAVRDAGEWSRASGSTAAAGTECCEDMEHVAATRPSSQRNQLSRTSCSRCGANNGHGKGQCPASGVRCLKCLKMGHFKKCCRAKAASRKDVAVVTGAVTAAASQLSSHPRVEVKVTRGTHGIGPTSVLAVADTGAMVCVAGAALMSKLQLCTDELRKCRDLRDVADMRVQCLGSATCHISSGDRSTQQNVYFVRSAKDLYLSLGACKGLGLVPEDFPRHTQMVGAACSEQSQGNETYQVPPRPNDMPYPPLEENIARLEGWLLKHFSSTTFNTSRSPLPVMAGPPHHIHLIPGATPHACHTPASVPKHWEVEVKAQLDEDVRRGVIEPVPAGEATDWCARMVVVAKKNGQPRRTVDFQRLNACCKRETHHTAAPFDMVSGIPVHTYKTVADAFWGFHQVSLDVESRRLTTFITPWGRFRYRRTPMGHCSASDAYTRRFDDAIQDIPRKYKCVDDTLLYDISVEDAFWHVYELLDTCAKSGITLKPEKFRFCRREAEFVGFHLGWDHYQPTPERLAAIRDFPMPSQPTITDIRSWHGMVNQLAPFLATAPLMEPFRELLRRPAGKRVYWDDQLQQKFQQAQATLCQLAKDGLVYYEKSRPTAVVTDWSKEGIGFVVLQQHCRCTSPDSPFCCKGGWRLALCGSRHLSSAEAGYSAIEGEALAVAWCLRKARLFLLGCPNLVVVTDHRPLVGLFRDRSLADVLNPRLFRLKEKTLQYRFTIKYLPGKRNKAADSLSRFPALKAKPDEDDMDQEWDIAAATRAMTVAVLNQDSSIVMDEETVAKAAAEDPDYQLLMKKVQSGDWHPHKGQEIPCLRPYYAVRERLAVIEDLVTYTFGEGSVRLVIPSSLRHRVASSLHAGHQGLDSMLRRARHSVYWPGMEGDLQHHRNLCQDCEKHSPSQPQEALVITAPPDYPFQQVVADMFQLEGNTYLAYADRLTGWLELTLFPSDASSGKIISRLRQFFTRWGAPEEISTDGGTNFASAEMTAFLRTWGVRSRLSSAHYPQSNGRAEAAVKAAKRLLRSNTGPGGSLDNDRASKALLQYLNTPLRDVDKSPAQLATGRQLRDSIPVARQHYKIDQHWKRSLRRREQAMVKAQDELPQVRGGVQRSLPPLEPGTQVRVQDANSKLWDRTGIIIAARPHRQYLVKLAGSGRISIRNRRHLRQTQPLSPTNPPLDSRQGGSNNVAEPPDPDPATETPSTPRPNRQRRQPVWSRDYVM